MTCSKGAWSAVLKAAAPVKGLQTLLLPCLQDPITCSSDAWSAVSSKAAPSVKGLQMLLLPCLEDPMICSKDVWSGVLKAAAPVKGLQMLLLLPCLEDPMTCFKDAWSAVLKAAAINIPVYPSVNWAANTTTAAAKSALAGLQSCMLDLSQPCGWLHVSFDTIRAAAATAIVAVLLSLASLRRPRLDPQHQSCQSPQAIPKPQSHHPQQSQPHLQPQLQMPQPQPLRQLLLDHVDVAAFPATIPMHILLPMKLYCQVLVPSGLGRNTTFIQALSTKSLQGVLDTLTPQQIQEAGKKFYLDAVCKSLGITQDDMPNPSSAENMRHKLLHSTALAMLLAWNFPSNNDTSPALVAMLQDLQVQLSAAGATHGVVVKREYGGKSNHSIHSELVDALGLQENCWTWENKKMTVTVPAMVAVAKLLSM
jgi:hypothetical protein